VNYTIPGGGYTIDYTVTANTGAARPGTITIAYPSSVTYTLQQDAPAPAVTLVNPSSAAQGTSRTFTLTGSNFFSGDYATVSTSGLSVTGFSVTSSTQATVTLTATNSAATGPATVTIYSPLGTANTTTSVQIVPQLLITAPTTLPVGVVNTAYGPVTFTATGGTGGYSWSSGTTGMPPGLSISTAGVLSGTPTSLGTFSPAFAVFDSELNLATVTLSVSISPPLNTVPGVELTASDGAALGQFGISVAVSGDTAVVGASGTKVGSNVDQGVAYVFVRSGGVWSQH